MFSVMGRLGLGVHLLLKTLVKTDCESIHKSMKVFINFPRSAFSFHVSSSVPLCLKLAAAVGFPNVLLH